MSSPALSQQVPAEREAAAPNFFSPQPDAADLEVVHDLGNLIQIASSALRALTGGAARGGAESKALVNQAKFALDRASALVNQSLRSSLGHRIAREPVSVAEVLEDVASMVPLEDRISLTVACRRGLPAISCNRIDLQVAILNLLMNARDALPGGGRIVVEASIVEQSPSSAPFVTICVSDDGVGMPEEVMARAFEPRFTTRPSGVGGLGLAMVMRFALDCGGRAQIESRPGDGTTVKLLLPTGA